MLIRSTLFFLSLFYLSSVFSQQVIRGVITDQDSKQPLPGATIFLNPHLGDKSQGIVTDIDGKFEFKEVQIGQFVLQVSFVGYISKNLSGEVNSGKQTVVEIELQESVVNLESYEVKATRRVVRNKMATVSSRVFSVEETDRYAGSRGDPARMASNFAGVSGSDDSRNDIVVRGNSPLGVVYKVEGIQIPNPNHFSVSGSSGGSVSILNNKSLGNSDFYTGAFPAEFGNSISGVFDLNLRSGNNDDLEMSFRLGLLGTEAMIEGPVSKKGTSILLLYRYSTLALFSSLDFNLGTSAVPRYQDLNFKINHPLKGGGDISLWGIAGRSNIDILISNQKNIDEIDLYGENDRDQYFGSNMYTTGFTFQKPLKNNFYFKGTISLAREVSHTKHEYIYRHVDENELFVLDSLQPILGYDFEQNYLSVFSKISKKVNAKSYLEAGIHYRHVTVDFQDSIFNLNIGSWNRRWNHRESMSYIEEFIQYRHKFSDKLSLTSGMHFQQFTLNNNSLSYEPRLGFKWQMNETTQVTYGLGIHSQLQPLYTYFYDEAGADLSPVNKDMGMTRSIHNVVGFQKSIRENIAFKAEMYYQYLFNVPVTSRKSAFSMVNAGSGFTRIFEDSLVNKGTAENYGIDITLERYFSNSWHALVTTSLYSSRYLSSNNTWYNSSFDGTFASSLLLGKVFKVKEKNSFQVGTAINWAGGKRYGNVDTLLSKQAGEVIFRDNGFNEYQFPNYFRADVKLLYKINKKKVTHHFALDLVNVLSYQNILNLTYAPVEGRPDISPIRRNYQLGFLPIFYYQIDF